MELLISQLSFVECVEEFEGFYQVWFFSQLGVCFLQDLGLELLLKDIFESAHLLIQILGVLGFAQLVVQMVFSFMRIYLFTEVGLSGILWG